MASGMLPLIAESPLGADKQASQSLQELREAYGKQCRVTLESIEAG